MKIIYVLFLVQTPITVIWSLNTLFPSLELSYSHNNWLALSVMIILLKTDLIKNVLKEFRTPLYPD